MFHGKFLTLINREKSDLSIKGYLKCDFFLFHELKPIYNNLTMPKLLNSTIYDFVVNEK